jgi:hypothetical protein
MRAHRARRALLVGAAALVLAFAALARSRAQTPELSPDLAAAIAQDAYVYGYPLVTMELTRRVMTNVVRPDGVHAPMGQFANLRSYPPPSAHEVTTPNADTLYSVAWLDVSREPWVLSIPDAHDRYYLLPLLDGWTNVFQSPGKRTTGTGRQVYAITGPGWRGTLPPGVSEYKSPTGMVWIIGRTYATGTPADYREVHAFQDELALVPLHAYGKAYTRAPGVVDPGIDMDTPPRDQVDRLDGARFFQLLAMLMKDNPPSSADAPLVARMARIGLQPGREFDARALGDAVANAIAEAPRAARGRIMAHASSAGRHINGWTVTLETGVYGTDYLQRAYIAAVGLGANRPEDAVYPMSEADGDDQPYRNANRYVIHFGKGQTPPVNAFWSVTMYGPDLFFVPNPMNKYTVSPRNDLVYNSDGSLDLYIQKTSPGRAREANWLPAPADRFALVLRMYWPEPPVLQGQWVPPPVRKLPPSRASRPPKRL